VNKAVIEITPRKAVAYTLIAASIILLMYVGVSALLLASGSMKPLKVEMPSNFVNPNSGVDVVIGVLLQTGMYGVLVGVALALANIGAKLTKD
jgi:hypothetical protein